MRSTARNPDDESSLRSLSLLSIDPRSISLSRFPSSEFMARCSYSRPGLGVKGGSAHGSYTLEPGRSNHNIRLQELRHDLHRMKRIDPTRWPHLTAVATGIGAQGHVADTGGPPWRWVALCAERKEGSGWRGGPICQQRGARAPMLVLEVGWCLAGPRMREADPARSFYLYFFISFLFSNFELKSRFKQGLNFKLNSMLSQRSRMPCKVYFIYLLVNYSPK
jgi:hypothetical protein